MNIKVGKKQVVCVVIGLVIYLFLEIIAGKNDNGELFLKRNGYGEGEVEHKLRVVGLGRDAIPVEINLRERVYPEDQVTEIFEVAFHQLKNRMLGENKSLEEIREDLDFIPMIPEFGISVSWNSQNVQLVDSFGTVNNDNIGEAEQVIVTITLSDGLHTQEKQIVLMVYPKSKSESEMLIEQLLNKISELDRIEQNAEGIWLPNEYAGYRIFYKGEEESHNEVFLIFGFLAAMLYYLKEQDDVRKADITRKNQMQLDYSEIISKFIIFLGAGMSTRKALELMVIDYEKQISNKLRKPRFIYEELSYTWNEIQQGIAERKAFEAFGRKCGLSCYMKLSGLLDQHRKMGNKKLREILADEMQSALEMRKQLAKKSGEEAGTKLLLPLFLLLGIVMGMVMIPAIWSMV